MIHYKIGNLLQANTEALVNTVNTVGVMGKGIALQFKEAFPENYEMYREAAEKKSLRPGQMFVYHTNRIDGVKYIINFPTKTEWYLKSKYIFIEEGLQDLVNIIETNKIKSIAIPPLGCGHGGLKWEKVKPLMEKYLSPLTEIQIIIFEPDASVKQILREQEKKKDIGLNGPRAMLLYSLFHYEGTGEHASLFVANKLSYLLQRLGEKQMRLHFIAHYYGPYSNQVDRIMYAFNGKYLNGLEQRNAKAFDPLYLNYEIFDEIKQYTDKHLTIEQQHRLKSLLGLIDGFQSALALEVLTSVDFVLSETPGLSQQKVIEKIHAWSDRKKSLINEKHVSIAMKRLEEYQQSLVIG